VLSTNTFMKTCLPARTLRWKGGSALRLPGRARAYLQDAGIQTTAARDALVARREHGRPAAVNRRSASQPGNLGAPPLSVAGRHAQSTSVFSTPAGPLGALSRVIRWSRSGCRLTVTPLNPPSSALALS